MATQTTTATTKYSNDFDFQGFFGIIKDAPVGTRLYLAQVLLDNAREMMNLRQKDLRSQLEDLIAEVESVRETRKKYYEQLERSTNVKG